MNRTLAPIALALFAFACEAPPAASDDRRTDASAPSTGTGDAPLDAIGGHALAGVFVPAHLAVELGCEGPDADQSVGEALARCAADAPGEAKPEPAACPDPSDLQLKGNPQLAELVSACDRWLDVAPYQYVLTHEMMPADFDGDPLVTQSFVVGGEVQSAMSGGMPVFDGPTVLRTFESMAMLLGQPNKQISLQFNAESGYIEEIAIRTADGSAWHVTDIDVLSVWDESFSKEVPVY